ncbi:MAG: F0F1 ATP synthase subunit delta [Candidatus Omnitrophica bacterium]|nr:F0F1 ATP synthase subunit delta [Candidatus Omnitrophota bacterium]
MITIGKVALIIFAQALVFAGFIFLFKKITVGDTDSAVNRLNDSYKEIESKKEELVRKIQEIETDYQRRKAEAEKVANDVKEQSEKEAYEKRDEILKKSRADADRIISEAVQRTETLKEDIRKEEHILIIGFCKEILTAVFTEDIKSRLNDVLIDDFLNNLNNLDMSHVPTNIDEIEITTVVPVSAEVKQAILDVVEKKINMKLPVKETLNDQLLGGATISFGSLLLDGSLAGKLKEKTTEMRKLIELEG